MASPSLFSQGFSLSAGLTDTTFSPTLSTHAAGDLIEVDVGADGNIGISITGGSGGWTKVWELQNTTGSTTPTMAKFYKLAASSSETLDLTGTAGEAWAASSRVYRGGGGTLNYYSPTPVNGTDSGSGTDGQGSAVNPGAGTQDFTFTQCMVMDGIQGTNAAPSGYGNYQTNNNAAAARVDVSTAELASTATGNTPAAWDSNAEQWIVGGGAVWESASGASQTIAFTLEDVTASFAQTATHPQSLAATLDGVAVSVAQTLSHSQALSATLDDVSASIAQTAQHPQSLAITLDDVDATINQSIGAGNSQTIDFTLDGVTVAIAQTASHPQSLVATLDGITVAVAQTAQHSQALAVTLDGVSVAISQGSQHAQALAATLDGVTVDIQQSVSPANKDQALAITLDGVLVSIDQIGPDNVLMGGGFFTQAMRRRLFEEEMREKLKELPQEVAEVIETTVIEAIDRPKLPTTKEIRRALEVENLPYREAYRKAVVSLVQEMRQIEEDDEEEAIALAFLF